MQDSIVYYLQDTLFKYKDINRLRIKGCVVGRIMLPSHPNPQNMLPYVGGQRNFADVIQVMDLEMEQLYWVTPGSSLITKVLKSGEPKNENSNYVKRLIC